MPKLHELRLARGQAIDEMNALAAADKFDRAAFATKETAVKDLDDQIAAVERSNKLQASLANPVGLGDDNAHGRELNWGLPDPRAYNFGDGLTVDGQQVRKFNGFVRAARAQMQMQYDPQKHFRSLGDQLIAIAADALQNRAGRSSPDARLVRAPTGASEVDPTGGGFLVQTDFGAGIFMLAHEMGKILQRVNKIPISAASNGLKIRGVDETSRATGSRWGGVQSYWAAEGNSVTPTKPKFRIIEFDLKKLFSLMYTTEELLQDSTALSAIAAQAFSEEIMFMAEDAIWEGTGAGQPLGITQSPALVTVAKDNGQVAGTISKANIDNMWSRMWARSRDNAVWFMNQDCEPQLAALNGPVGTGGELVYMPPGGLSSKPFATLKGLPVETVEYASALGTPGDIGLIDFSQYTLVDKGGVQAANSMHVAFLTDEMVFRITYRVDGKPMWYAPLTPFKGTLTKSPFVMLAQR